MVLEKMIRDNLIYVYGQIKKNPYVNIGGFLIQIHIVCKNFTLFGDWYFLY